MRVALVDPSSFSRPYDHELATALTLAGADVELVTSRFEHAQAPPAEGYRIREAFYPWRPGTPGSGARRVAKALQHPLGMHALRRRAAAVDVVHFQWLPLESVDQFQMPRRQPTVLTLHNVMRSDARALRRTPFQRILNAVHAVIVHTHEGRRHLIDNHGVDPRKVTVVKQGAYSYLTRQRAERPLPAELAAVDAPVVLMFGLLRPYKGLDTLLEAWRGIRGAELWIVGDPRMDVSALRAAAPATVRFLTGFIEDEAVPAYFRRADLVVLPYDAIDQSGVAFVAMAFGRPMLLSAIGGFREIADDGGAELVAPGDAPALRGRLDALLADPSRRDSLGASAARLASTEYAWSGIARRTLEVYEEARVRCAG
jgi:glycosyltransferase involved in cell wall biosynthesis